MTFTLSGTVITQSNESSINITGTATHADGTNVTTTSAHGYSAEDMIQIGGTTDHDGAHEILSVPDTTHFVIGDAFTTSQTGTAARGDKDHSGLESITGVTTTDLSVTDYPYHIYDATDLDLVVAGALQLNQFEEYLLIDQVDINDGGTYLRGITRTEPATAGSSFDARLPITCLHVKKRGVNPQNDPGFKVNVGGHDVINGSMMLLHSGYRAYYTDADNQAKVDINDGYIYIEGVATQNSKPYKIRFDCTDVRINGLKQYGGAFTTERTLDEFNGFEPTHYEGWQVPVQSDKTIFFEAGGYAGGGRGNIQDIRWTNTLMGLPNCATGPNVVGAAHGVSDSGVMRITQDIKVKATDLAGNALGGARYFLRDIDNSNRTNYTQNGNNIDYLGDQTHTGETDDTTGETDTAKVLTSVTVANAANYDGAVRDHRFSDDVLATATIPVWRYGSVYAPIRNASLIGTETVTLETQMADDATVTGTAAEAAAHNVVIGTANAIGIDESMTLDDLRDYLKYAKTTIDNIENPTVSTEFVAPSGKSLDFGSLDLTIATGVTLSPGTKFTSLVTTGTLTIDGTMTATYTDSTGAALLIRTSPVSAKLRILEYESDGTTLTQTIEGDSDSDGTYVNTFPPDAILDIHAKKHGYAFDLTRHDMADGLEVDVSINSVTHIDTALDISAYKGADDTGYTDKFLFQWDSTEEKGHWVIGETNTSSLFNTTAAVLDERISSQAGLEFFAFFRQQAGYDDHLAGNPYTWSHDRLEINEDYMDFIRVATTPSSAISRIGVPVKKRNGVSDYIAPESEGSRVQFDNVAVLVPGSVLTAIVTDTQDAIERTDGTLQSVHDTLDTRLTAARAALLDHLDADISSVGGGGGGSGPTAAEIRTEMESSGNYLADIKGAVDNFQFTPIGSYLEVAAYGFGTAGIAQLKGVIWDEATSDVTAAGSMGALVKTLALEATLDTVDTVVDSIKDTVEKNLKIDEADIIVASNGESYELKDGSTTLETYNRRATTTDKDWSGGREKA